MVEEQNRGVPKTLKQFRKLGGKARWKGKTPEEIKIEMTTISHMRKKNKEKLQDVLWEIVLQIGNNRLPQGWYLKMWDLINDL